MNAAPEVPELISFGLCPYVQRAIIVLTEKGVAHRRTYIDLANKPDWFREISPLSKVPAMRIGDVTLFESAVICEYIDEVTPGSLHPADPVRRAKHRSWIEFGSSILASIAGFYSARTPSEFEEKRQALAAKFAWVEGHLGDGGLFDGDDFHMVDAVYATIFRYFDVIERIGDFGAFEGLARMPAYRRALMVRPSVVQAVMPGYQEDLFAFFLRRDSQLGDLARARMAA